MTTPPPTTVFGLRVWPTPILKPLFPFMISGSLAFFLFSFVHTKMMDGEFQLHDAENGQLFLAYLFPFSLAFLSLSLSPSLLLSLTPLSFCPSLSLPRSLPVSLFTCVDCS